MAFRVVSLLVLLAIVVNVASVVVQAQSLRGLAAADQVLVNTDAPYVDPTDDDLSDVTEEPSSNDVNSNYDFQSFQEDLLAAVNNERRKAGLPDLCLNAKLTSAAQKHSEDMASNGFMSHTGSDGSSLSTRVNRENFRWSGLAENVAAGQQTVEAVMSSWMNSSGHRRNILGNYKFFGGGMARNPNARYGIYWTQVFGSGDQESCACLVE